MRFSEMTVDELKAIQPGTRVHTTRGPGVFSYIRFGPPTWAVSEAACVHLDHYQETLGTRGRRSL